MLKYSFKPPLRKINVLTRSDQIFTFQTVGAVDVMSIGKLIEFQLRIFLSFRSRSTKLTNQTVTSAEDLFAGHRPLLLGTQ